MYHFESTLEEKIKLSVHFDLQLRPEMDRELLTPLSRVSGVCRTSLDFYFTVALFSFRLVYPPSEHQQYNEG